MIVTSTGPSTGTADVAAVATPCGSFTVVARDDTVLASGWTADIEALVQIIARPLRPGDWRRRRDLGPLTSAVLDYLAGDLAAVGRVPVRQQAGPFTEQVWQELRHVAAGSPVSYTELAVRSGRPAAVRAVGNACGRNTAALFIPCHRVLRRGGELGGFRWGVDVKQWLLEHESAAQPLRTSATHDGSHQNGSSVTLASLT